MAEAADARADGKSAEAKSPPPADKGAKAPAPPRRSPRSVLKVSQLLLRAISAHRGLTLDALKRELGNAGYRVRRRYCCHSGEARADDRATLLRVSGNGEASGYFRVWKVPKPKKKPGAAHPHKRCPARPSAGPRGAHRSRGRHKAAKKTREACRPARGRAAAARRRRPRAKEPARARAKAPAARDSRPRARETKKANVKARDDKKPEPEKLGKKTVQKPASVNSDGPSAGQGGKVQDLSPARSKVSAKSVKMQSPRSQ